MKNSTYLKSLFLILFLSVGLIVNAQPPFGNPPGSNPPTADEFVKSGRPTVYVPPSPDPLPTEYDFGGSNLNGLCISQNVENTGNDIQIVDGENLTAQVMVWDGDCPHFSLIVSGDPITQSPLEAAFIVAIHGRNYGTVHDPDIIVAQNNINLYEIDILLVYELHKINSGITTSYIAYEQWKYNHNTNIIELVLVPDSYNPANIISEDGVNSHNPNIDANNNNEVVVVFETLENIYSYVDYIGSPTIFNPIPLQNNNYTINPNIIDIGHCTGSGGMSSPDASISDDGNYDSQVSYVYNYDGDLYVIQDKFSSLLPTAVTAINCYDQGGFAKLQFVKDAYIHPRISSPSATDIAFEEECAITAVSDNLRDIGLFTNHYTGYGQIVHITDLNNGGQNLLQSCEQTMPSITYAHESNAVVVAWTYDDCRGYINWDKEVISVAFNFSTGRIPSNHDYFMKVNQTHSLDQYASSVAGESQTNYSGDIGLVLYTLASETDDIIFKVSNVNNQPQLRIKNINDLATGKPMANVYPNPTNGVLNLVLSNVDSESLVNINIYTMQGKVVHQENQFLKDLKNEYDLSGLGKGTYFVEIKSTEINYSKKVIVE